MACGLRFGGGGWAGTARSMARPHRSPAAEQPRGRSESEMGPMPLRSVWTRYGVRLLKSR